MGGRKLKVIILSHMGPRLKNKFPALDLKVYRRLALLRSALARASPPAPPQL